MKKASGTRTLSLLTIRIVILVLGCGCRCCTRVALRPRSIRLAWLCADAHSVHVRVAARACVCIGGRGKRWVSGPVVGAVWRRHALSDAACAVCLFVCALGLICQCRTITQQCACVDERAADGASTFLDTCCPSRTTTASLHRGRDRDCGHVFRVLNTCISEISLR
jgi:hypothetical protein